MENFQYSHSKAVFNKSRKKSYRAASSANAAVLSIGGAGVANGVPVTFTGCLSEFSTCAKADQTYLDALKSYAEVYAAHQAYLAASNVPLPAHDYTVSVDETEEHSLLGLLGEDESEQLGHMHAEISDEEIDRCGYLGWLRH